MAKTQRGGGGKKKKITKAGAHKAPLELYLEFLKYDHMPALYKALLTESDDRVIKTICNAALNLLKNPDIKLSKSQKQFFKKNRRTIATLASGIPSLASKRRLLVQKGRGFIGPAIAAVSSLIGLANHLLAKK